MITDRAADCRGFCFAGTTFVDFFLRFVSKCQTRAYIGSRNWAFALVDEDVEEREGDCVIVEISAAVAAAAFVVLVIYTVVFLRAAGQSLDQANEALSQVRQELREVSRESVALLESSRVLIQDVETTMHALDPIFLSLKQSGQALETVTHSVRQVSAAVNRSASGIEAGLINQQSRIAEAAEYAAIGVQLWHKWQSHRTAKAKEQQAKKEESESHVQ